MVVDDLKELLADSYILYLKTQNYHWNVVDPRFAMLHKLFEEQYDDLAEAVDTIAEQIRALDAKAPGTMKEFLELTRLKEASGREKGSAMVKALHKDHQSMVKSLNEMIVNAQEEGDEGTADLMIERLRVHQKTAWMLKSHL